MSSYAVQDHGMVNGGSKTTILVAGATGYIGGLLVPRLRERAEHLRCLARTPSKLQHLSDSDVEVMEGNVLEPDSLPPVLDGVDIAYYLIHSMGTGASFHDLDATGARQFAEAAADAGLERIIYLGGLARGNPDDLSEHLKSRHEVGELLGSTGVPVTELRASIIVGSGSASFEIIRDLVAKLPLMITPKWVNSRCEPVAAEDVITYLVRCLDAPDTIGKTLEIGSGEVYTYAEMMHVVAEVMDRSITMLKVPVLTPRLSAYWLNLITSVPTQIAYPLVDGLRNDSFCTDDRILEMIPMDRTSFREALMMALAEESERRLISRWTTSGQTAVADGVSEPNEAMDPLQDQQRLETRASPEKLFEVVSRIGGKTGYYYADWLWTIRGFIDRLLGGPGLRRGRRDAHTLRPGDTVDFWRVEEVERNRYLRLRAEMKLPGTAWLEFEMSRNPDGGTTFRQEATFAVSRFSGYVYWLCLLPLHLLIFKHMAREIVKKAERRDA